MSDQTAHLDAMREVAEGYRTLLSKDDLWQAAADLPTEDVSLIDPAKGLTVGKVRMRGLTGRELEQYQQAQSSGKGVSFNNAMTGLVMLSAVNDDGSKMFVPSDRIKLSQAPAWMLMQMFEVAGKLSGVTEGDVKEMVSDFDDAQSSTNSSN